MQGVMLMVESLVFLEVVEEFAIELQVLLFEDLSTQPRMDDEALLSTARSMR